MIDVQPLFKNILDKSMFVKELHRIIINDLNSSFMNILIEKETTVATAFTKIYKKTNETFIFLIDEWDIVFRESNDKNLQDGFMDFLISLFKNLNYLVLIWYI